MKFDEPEFDLIHFSFSGLPKSKSSNSILKPFCPDLAGILNSKYEFFTLPFIKSLLTFFCICKILHFIIRYFNSLQFQWIIKIKSFLKSFFPILQEFSNSKFEFVALQFTNSLFSITLFVFVKFFILYFITEWGHVSSLCAGFHIECWTSAHATVTWNWGLWWWWWR